MSSPLTGRLFLALWPSQAVRHQLAAWQAVYAWPSGTRVVPAADLHLTLHFIGPISTDRYADVVTGLDLASRTIEVVLDMPAIWRDDLAVIRPSQVPASLLDLHGQLEEQLRRLDLPVERRPYKPHVTLARRCAGAHPSRSPPDPVVWVNQDFVLAARHGPGYRVLRRYGAVAKS